MPEIYSSKFVTLKNDQLAISQRNVMKQQNLSL